MIPIIRSSITFEYCTKSNFDPIFTLRTSQFSETFFLLFSFQTNKVQTRNCIELQNVFIFEYIQWILFFDAMKCAWLKSYVSRIEIFSSNVSLILLLILSWRLVNCEHNCPHRSTSHNKFLQAAHETRGHQPITFVRVAPSIRHTFTLNERRNSA